VAGVVEVVAPVEVAEVAPVAAVVEVVAPVEVAEVAPVAAVVEVVAPVEVAEVAPVAAVVEVVAPMAEALALDASVAAGAGGMIPEEVAGPVGSREQRLADWYRRRTGPAMPSAVIGQIQERGPIGMEAPASTESVQPRPSGAKIDAGAEQSRAIAGAKPPAALAAPVSPALLLPVTVRAARGSRIEIDGADRGNAPLFGLLLSQGVHRVAETSSQGVRVEVEFDVHDENLTLDFTRANAIDTGDVSDSGAGDEPLRMDEDANDQRAQHDAAGQDDAA
jgi:hypothetical protein